MTEDQVHDAFDNFTDELDKAMDCLKVPCLSITSAYFDSGHIIGGEAFRGVQGSDGTPDAITAAEFVSMLGYVEARCALLRHESKKMFGKDLSTMVEAAKQHHLRDWL